MIAQVSPFNQLKVHDSLQNYSFIVSGHFYGQSTNQSTFPAATLLANIDTLNKLHPSFLMSLGDMFMDVDDTYLNHYKLSFFDKIKFPLFNAVGNHDISNGNRYEKEFGKSYFSFNIASELYIVLNTELNDGSIKGEQYSFLESILKDAEENKSIKNIFVFSHRPIWAEKMDKYSKLFLENTRTAIGSNNFLDEVIPLFVPLKERNMFWLSGSMAGGPASFFYDKNDEVGITFIQTAIRDTPRDAMLLVNVKAGQVSFEGLSLTNQKLNSIESYDIDFWLKDSKPEPEFSYRLIPLYLKNMLLHRYFWYGVLASLLVVLSIRFVIKRKK
jgi:hypothetical protein